MKKIILGSFASVLIVSGLVWQYWGERPARADDGPKTTVVSLPSGQKLVSASWRCFAACDLWPLTRPMRKGESVEAYTFTNNNGETYLLKESAQ